MRNNTWRAFAAVVLCILVSPVSAKTTIINPPPPASTPDPVIVALNEIEITLKHSDEASRDNIPCNPGADNRKSDLCAQWKAADAASSAAYWTENTFWLGMIGVLIGAFTLVAAVAAAWYARNAAQASQHSADAFIAVERGNLSHVNASVAQVQGNEFTLDLWGYNSGRSSLIVRRVSWKEVDSPVYDSIFDSHKVTHTTIGSSDERQESHEITKIEMILKDTSVTRFIVGFANYHSLGRNFMTYFCIRISPTDNPPGSFVAGSELCETLPENT